MKGYYTPRKAGWDTHGLPVELEIEKKLGFTSKSQIENYGVAKFNAQCRESVFGYLKKWDALTERIGFWVDLAASLYYPGQQLHRIMLVDYKTAMG